MSVYHRSVFSPVLRSSERYFYRHHCRGCCYYTTTVAFPIFLTSPPPPSTTTSFPANDDDLNDDDDDDSIISPSTLTNDNIILDNVVDRTKVSSVEGLTYLQLLNGVDMANDILPQNVLSHICNSWLGCLSTGRRWSTRKNITVV